MQVLDIDRIVDDALEWEFAVKVRGVVYLTRPLVLADVLRLQQALASNSYKPVQDAVIGLLPPEARGASDNWRLESLLAVAAAVLNYWQRQVRKNGGSIAAKVDAAMATPTTPTPTPTAMSDGSSTPGTSTPPSPSPQPAA